MSLEYEEKAANPAVIVIPASESHVKSIYKITRDAFSQYVKDAKIPGTVDALKETPDDIARDLLEKTIFVALVNGVPAGSIRLTLSPDNTVYISRFGVFSEYQSLGIGRELINKSIAFLKDNKIHSVSLHTAAESGLVGFYKQFGFTISEVSNEKGYPRALMTLILD